jgi:hypothetical protein
MVDEADAHRGGTCGDEQGAAEAEALYASPLRGEPESSGVLAGLDGFDLALFLAVQLVGFTALRPRATLPEAWQQWQRSAFTQVW